MNTAVLPALEIETSAGPSASVIWLHGLGADGHDFEGVVPMLELPSTAAVRFVFPHAPVRPITRNAGMKMRAWYDVAGTGLDCPQDEAGIRTSEASLQALIRREQERGVAPPRIVLAGFSQGGAIALHTGLRCAQRLAGILALSTYLPLAERLPAERHDANHDIPILMIHGTEDTVIPVQIAESSCSRLQESGYLVEWLTYPMPHTIAIDEIRVIGSWLRRVLEL